MFTLAVKGDLFVTYHYFNDEKCIARTEIIVNFNSVIFDP
jgi:hypothetical protein